MLMCYWNGNSKSVVVAIATSSNYLFLAKVIILLGRGCMNILNTIRIL